MVLYRITLVSLAEDLRAVDPGLLSPFYADDVAFDGSARRSAHLLNLLMERGLEQRCSIDIGSCPGVSEIKRDLSGLEEHPCSSPLSINRFNRCALLRADPSNATSSA